MNRKGWVDDVFGLGGRETPEQLEGMTGREYIDLICAHVEADQKERDRAGYLIIAIAVIGVIVLGAWFVLLAQGDDCWLRGDGNIDGDYSITDVLVLINFINAPSPPAGICTDWADVDGNGWIDQQDVYYLLAHLFQGGAAPPDYPGVCCK